MSNDNLREVSVLELPNGRHIAVLIPGPDMSGFIALMLLAGAPWMVGFGVLSAVRDPKEIPRSPLPWG